MNRAPTHIPTLAAQFATVTTKQEFGYALRDYLDQFRVAPDAALLQEEPALLDARLQDGGVADAYLAAAAAWLSHQHGISAPDWAQESKRILEIPFFAAKTHGLRMILLQESPAEFRVRNLFVSANALSRA
ncbi:hypothetical protein SAMN02745166_03408 [Prosthecobacter debontii]|uniref:Uncharacterized protein n=1 Tax=Prosthecobacter debontii TaxID=48467 RepID=A0A1T4YID3_9BACT|nr:hypothetical protein [Prosthecobacter debontii]SKB01582.1 hypothetical protein SAMN02745166_03408 [Prosthecobacter debontii]